MIVLQAAQEKIRVLQFSPDSRTLVAPCSFGVQVWHHLTGGLPENILEQGGVAAVRFTPDGKQLLLCGPRVIIADLPSHGATSVPLERGTRTASCDLSPAGRFLVVAEDPRPDLRAHGGLNAWLERRARLCCRSMADPGSSLWTVDASGRVVDVPMFLPKGEQFVVLEWLREVRFVTRDTRTGAVLSEEQVSHAAVLDNPVMSPDGRLIACRSKSRVTVYRVESLTAEPVIFENDNPKEFTGLAFHPSGRYLAATSNDATVKLYDTATWKVAQAFNWDIGRLRSVAFSPDGMLAAAGGDEGKIVVWDVDL
jgi:WD40 repeat protein